MVAARVALTEIALVHDAQDAVAWRYDNLLTAPRPDLYTYLSGNVYADYPYDVVGYDKTHLRLLTGQAYLALRKFSEAIMYYKSWWSTSRS